MGFEAFDDGLWVILTRALCAFDIFGTSPGLYATNGLIDERPKRIAFARQKEDNALGIP